MILFLHPARFAVSSSFSPLFRIFSPYNVGYDILCGIVPKEIVMATLQWLGVPEAEVRIVEGTYEKTTARVVVGEGASEEFEVNIGLRQGIVLSPLLFIALLDLIRRKTGVMGALRNSSMQTTWPWWRMANMSYRIQWRSGTVCLPDIG